MGYIKIQEVLHCVEAVEVYPGADGQLHATNGAKEESLEAIRKVAGARSLCTTKIFGRNYVVFVAPVATCSGDDSTHQDVELH